LTSIWKSNGHDLRSIFLSHSQSVAAKIRYEIVSQQVLSARSSNDLDILDLGGGYGLQAIIFASIGHTVTVVDSDSEMLNIGEKLLKKHSLEVSENIKFINNDILDFLQSDTKKYDVICCHSVLMYLDNPLNVLNYIKPRLKDGGLVSILNLNRSALPIRKAMQCNWEAALNELKGVSESCYKTKEPTKRELISYFDEVGIKLLSYNGVGIFSDQFHNINDIPNFDILLNFEADISGIEPFRNMARSFHLLFTNTNS
jgi:S-adenosylmethionine-dependent methyltransferase